MATIAMCIQVDTARVVNWDKPLTVDGETFQPYPFIAHYHGGAEVEIEIQPTELGAMIAKFVHGKVGRLLILASDDDGATFEAVRRFSFEKMLWVDQAWRAKARLVPV